MKINLLSNSGFTLIEMLAVIAVLGILMSVSLPQVMDITDTARKTAAKMEIMHCRLQVENLLAGDTDISEVSTELGLEENDFEIDWHGELDQYYKLSYKGEKFGDSGDKYYYFDSEENEILFSD